MPITKDYRFGSGPKYSGTDYDGQIESILREKDKEGNFKIQTADYNWLGDLIFESYHDKWVYNGKIINNTRNFEGECSWTQEHHEYGRINRGSNIAVSGAAQTGENDPSADFTHLGTRLVLEPYESYYDGMYLLREVKGNDFISYQKSLDVLEIKKPVLDYPTNVSSSYNNLKNAHKKELENGGMWLEFMDTKYKNDKGEPRIFYVSKKPLTKGISWDELFEAGCVYGPDLVGPDGLIKTHPEKYKNNNKLYRSKITKIGDKYFVPRLLRGTSNYGADPNGFYNYTDAPNSEWNRSIVAATKQYRDTPDAMEAP